MDPPQDDPDVAAEAKRVEGGGGTEDVVRLEKLRKALWGVTGDIWWSGAYFWESSACAFKV